MKIWITNSGYRVIQILSGRSNVFLVTDGKKNILVDTSPKFMWRLLQKRLKKLNVSTIDYLIITHVHFDHAANANRIRKKYKARIIIHKNEAHCLVSGKNAPTGGTNALTRILMKMVAKKFFSASGFEPCSYDLSVDDTYDLKDIGYNGSIIHTPGHTCGSLSVIIDDEVALVGDTLFGIFKWSVFPPFAEDTGLLIKSWGKLLQTKCPVFIPSHGTVNERSLVQHDYNKRTEKKDLKQVW
jgi:hydroxyacylglutathione hydrolase